MTATVYAPDPVDRHEREISLMIMRKRWPSTDHKPAPRSTRSVLILPPTGGVNQLDIQWAEQLCDKGIESWIVTAWDRGLPDYTLAADLLSHDKAGVRGISAIRQIAVHMSGRLGILGTSAGGILAAVALAVEPKFTTGVFIAAGADLPEIVSSSDLANLRVLREQRMRVNNWSPAEYKNQLRQTVLLDPGLFAEEMSAKKTGVVIAFRDRTVPVRQQLLLEMLANAVRISSFDDDHVTSIVKTGLIDSYKIVDFFRTNL